MSIVLIYSIWFFILGALLGSFAGVVACRLNTGRSIVHGRSICNTCGKQLTWYELVPLVSYLLQRGRCRGCHTPFGVSHVLIEILFGSVFVGAYLLEGIGLELLLLYGIFFCIGAIVLYDLMHTIIPNVLVYSMTILALLFAFFRNNMSFEAALPTLIVAGSMAAIFAGIWIVSRGRAMGLGDAKLVFPLALLLGYPAALTGFLLSFWLGAFISVLLLLYQRKHRTIKHEIPFAPYLALGFICTYLFQINLFPYLL